MELKRNGPQSLSKGPFDWFASNVRVEPLIPAPNPARVQPATVTFEPGARTAWHTHPLGPTLIVTADLGWAQRVGSPVERRPLVRPRREALARRNHRPDPHFHPGKLDGQVATWLEHVTDEQYRA